MVEHTIIRQVFKISKQSKAINMSIIEINEFLPYSIVSHPLVMRSEVAEYSIDIMTEGKKVVIHECSVPFYFMEENDWEVTLVENADGTQYIGVKRVADEFDLLVDGVAYKVKYDHDTDFNKETSLCNVLRAIIKYIQG